MLGVHAIGEDGTEIIYIGQGVLALDGTIEYFRDTIFNYPTFAEAYKIATHNGLNKRRFDVRKPSGLVPFDQKTSNFTGCQRLAPIGIDRHMSLNAMSLTGILLP